MTITGPCCVCEQPLTEEGGVNVCMLPRRAPVPGTGWGCCVCKVPNDGALAILCDKCLGFTPRFICKGNAGEAGRIAVDAYPDVYFDHDKPQEAHQ